ncbi:MAG: hypothetical protein WKF88_01990 [Ferruginibacter sp.]
MKKLFILSIIYAATGCSGDDETIASQPVATVSKDVASGPASLAGCYRMTIEKDTAYLELKQEGDSAFGPLVYKRFEKDSNTGTVSLKLAGDHADGWYIFNSEGKSTVRQIMFKTDSSGLAEGYGDIAIKGDSAYFKYPHALHFEEKHHFLRMPCK